MWRYLKWEICLIDTAMVYSTFWAADIHSAGKNISGTYGTWRFITLFTRVPTLSHLNPIHTITPYLFSIIFSNILPITPKFPIHLCTLLMSHACYMTYCILLDFINVITSGEKLWRSSLCNEHHLAVTSLLGPNIILRIVFSNTRFFLNYCKRRPCETRYKIICIIYLKKFNLCVLIGNGRIIIQDWMTANIPWI